MTIKNLIFGVLAVILIAVAALLVFDRPQQPQTVVTAISGPDINSPYVTYGGVMRYSQGAKMKASTTLPVVCSLRSPAATSTLVNAQADIQSGSTTAQTLYIAKGASSAVSSNGATTTNLASTPVLAKGNANLIASSTLMTSANTLFAPNTWVNFGFEQYGANDTVNGHCSAEWVLTKPM